MLPHPPDRLFLPVSLPFDASLYLSIRLASSLSLSLSR